MSGNDSSKNRIQAAIADLSEAELVRWDQLLESGKTEARALAVIRGERADRTDFLFTLAPQEWLATTSILNLDGTLVRDITRLAEYPQLEVLSLSGTRVTAIGALASLHRLSELSLAHTRVRELEPLEKLTSLSCIDLEGTEFSALAPICRLPSLTHLNLSNTATSSFDELASCIALTNLWLSGAQASDFEFLVELDELRELDLSGTSISELGCLSGLEHLERLNLASTSAVDLRPLYSLQSLETLLMTDTDVSEEQVFELQDKLPGLEILSDYEPTYIDLPAEQVRDEWVPISQRDPDLRGVNLDDPNRGGWWGSSVYIPVDRRSELAELRPSRRLEWAGFFSRRLRVSEYD